MKKQKKQYWKHILNKFNSKERIDTFPFTTEKNKYISRGSLPKTKTTLENILKSKSYKTLDEFNKISLSNPWDSDYLKGFTKTNVQQFISCTFVSLW